MVIGRRDIGRSTAGQSGRGLPEELPYIAGSELPNQKTQARIRLGCGEGNCRWLIHRDTPLCAFRTSVIHWNYIYVLIRRLIQNQFICKIVQKGRAAVLEPTTGLLHSRPSPHCSGDTASVRPHWMTYPPPHR
ncbi:hypothetical protein ADIMK_2993 [Marinobacterium lacunae]|uniref:Uncharacterized protein n=1 Tax=Marinobacterium lacunae TaxID=1232683 RepID=A0A081FWH9_9GAMM|nr:hypothetical protein ADIMK_2993 [Marinobacterium lacunae]